MKRWQLVLGLLILVGLGLALRLPHLSLRPMHVDEAVHADKLNTLWQTGRYAYDRNEYHGPTLYYLTLPAIWLSGARDYADWQASTLRSVPVVLGIGLILLLLLVADGLGRAATLCAAALIAISPALTYYSRYYIQEMLLVFFTFLVIAAGWRYAQTRRLGWALLAGASVGLMHATKETCVIALGCMLVAAVAAGVRPRGIKLRHVGAGLLTAILVSVVLFSGFFTNLAGPLDSLRAFGTYFQRAGEGGVHVHPWTYYLHILTFWRAGAGPIWSEGLILVLCLIGLVVAVRNPKTPLVRFLAIYTILMTVAYSAISYKTPWCILSALQAMTLLAGVGAVALIRALRYRVAQVVVTVILLAAGVHLGWQAQRANSAKFCNNERNPYVYAQTLYSVVDTANQLDRLAEVSPANHHLLIKVMVENCWPLPWYLRRFDRVGYWDTVPDDPDADVILVSSKLQPALASRLKGSYETHERGLRRDERLTVYIEQSLWHAFDQHLRSTTTNASSRPAHD